MKTLVLIGNDFCGVCKIAQQTYDLAGIEYDYYESDSEEGEVYVDQYNLRRIPVMINTTTGKIIVGEPTEEDIELLKHT